MRKLVLWGHHVDEYREMFDLSEPEIHTRLLEYGCGPSAVNAELSRNTANVVSCDPLFALDQSTLSTKVSLIFDEMAADAAEHRHEFDLTRYGDLKSLIAKRKRGIDTFFSDYKQGLIEKRYLSVQDYHLPFTDFSFDFALSAHYFFSDLDGQDVAFHVQMIRELARVAKEVRIFPLIDRQGQPSPMLGPVLLALQQDNFGTEVREVPCQWQRKGNVMLRVWAQQCEVS